MVSTREIVCNVGERVMTCYIARPDVQGPYPAVLIAHDGVGLEEYQRQRADLLAARGYLALAFDYNDGDVFFNRPEEMLARVIPLLQDVERMRELGQVALEQLLALPDVDPKSIAALGYGAGGKIILELARLKAGFKAIALVHPALPEAKLYDWQDVSGIFHLCTGSEDPICQPQSLLAFGGELQEAGADWRIAIYGGAEHAFWARPRKADGSLECGRTHTMATVPGVSYNPLQAHRSWQDVLRVFEEAFAPSAAIPA